VLASLLSLVQDPEADHPLRADLGEEFMRDRPKFMKTAEDFVKKHAEPRPS
jgi:ubiquitin-conjugating enzyme E2 L3